jgi:hypothetical protein
MSDSDDSLLEPDWTEPEWAVPDAAPAPWRARRARRAPVEPVRGRTAALVAVIAVVVVVGIIGAVVGTPPPPPPPALADGVAVSPVGSYSASAFCSAGTGTAATTTIYLTNSTGAPVTGVMTSVGPAAAGGAVPTVRRTVSVPALGSTAVNPADGLPAGSNATTFIFSGGGVVVSQVVSGPNGWSTAPCASQVASQWSFAGGATTAGNALTLSIYNPGATEAVVNVSFITNNGYETPQQYQGLVVPPGQLVEENVGDFVQDASTIATLVVAQAGGVVGSEFQQWSSGATGGVSLRLGSPRLATTWRLAQTTALPASTVNLYLANPGQAPVTATITLGLSSGSVVPHRVVVPPVSIVAFPASGTPGLPQQTPYAATVSATAPIVVGRSVLAPSGSTPPVWGSSSATTALAAHWLVPAPGIPSTPGTANAGVSSLAVANPGSVAARVSVTALGAVHPVAMFTVAPHEVAVLGPQQVGGLSALMVSASQPVDVEEDSGPAGAPGVVSSTGFPLDP